MAHKVNVFVEFKNQTPTRFMWEPCNSEIDLNWDEIAKVAVYRSEWWTRTEAPWEFPNSHEEKILGNIPNFKQYVI